MPEIIYYALDLETNGLSTEYHEICEFSLLRMKDKVQLTRNIKVDNPENSSLDALRITNKTIEDLKHGISREQLLADVDRFLNQDGSNPDNRCLVGHNVVNFDKRFLWALWEKQCKYFPINLYLDTLKMSKDYTKQLGLVKPKHTLEAMCDQLGIQKVAGLHNAKSDTRNCYLIFNELIKNGVDHLKHMEYISHAPIEEENVNELMEDEDRY